ncbi:MAG: hypothetical protein JJ862_10245 [Roseivirga sp.]|uniref:hypothetical protein n=1 Tax=Roseivirga sp. TaxID=1964215 RepID=UPI001B2E2AA9|nr:hypothetical protein [Roseivirga sp.]MBO6661350.1 hypothetical protein [Roseivirga sp.]MBO6908666.1 hypothetical protein [Roseivirga sp.]
MENNELLQLWKGYDQKLDQLLEIDKRKGYEKALDSAKKRFHKLTYEPIFEIVLAVIFISFTGRLMVAVWGVWPLTVVAVAFHAFLIATIIFDVNLIYRVKSLNYDLPMVELQKQIHQLKKAKMLEIKLILWGVATLAGPFVFAFLYVLLGQEHIGEIPNQFWYVNGSFCLILAFVAVHLSAGLSTPKTKLQKWFTSKLKFGGLDESTAILAELKA